MSTAAYIADPAERGDAPRPDQDGAELNRASDQLPKGFAWVYAALMVTMLLSALDQTIVSTALPTIVGELNGVQLMSWTLTAYILATTIVMPIYGKLGDLLGRKWIFIAAIGIFALGSFVAGAASDMVTLIIGRGIQGIGGGGLMIISQAIIADLVPARQRAKYVAPIGAVFGLSSVVGPLVGGWLTDNNDWRWVFWINLPLALIAVVVSAIALRLPRHPVRVSIDYLGIATMTVAVTATVLVANWAGTQYAWDDPTIIALSVVGLIGWVAFFFVESKAKEPIIPLSMLRNKIFVVATLLGMLVAGIGMFALVGYMPTYLQMVYGSSATESGLLLVPMVVGMLATSMVSGVLISRSGRYRLWPIVGTILVAVAFVLLATIQVSTPVWLVVSYLFLAGAGVGTMMQNLVLIVQNAFPSAEVGTATSANNFFRQIGGTVGIAVVGSVFTNRLTSSLATVLPGGFSGGSAASLTPSFLQTLPEAVRNAIIASYHSALVPIFGYLVPMFILGLVLAFILPEKPLAGSDEQAEDDVDGSSTDNREALEVGVAHV